LNIMQEAHDISWTRRVALELQWRARASYDFQERSTLTD
jgi:hypothetical protein